MKCAGALLFFERNFYFLYFRKVCIMLKTGRKSIYFVENAPESSIM
ncbi:hypothetical protein HMPREF7215_1592 [Pyramidobacter piscolens W5455]|uniref:Uncharacterized protein n=1 Tax=Pyramidobacter piscolens W5455 TaxID=352165 RepID=A0ABP2HRV8_9BACT|nr:hypothetical protein HMPREF7215_1592 [Pyramidobacter piscolens W5455]